MTYHLFIPIFNRIEIKTRKLETESEKTKISFKRLIISFKRYDKSFKRDVCCFDCHSNCLVSISALINDWKGNIPSRVPLLHYLSHITILIRIEP